MAAPLIVNEERHESVWTLSHTGLVSSNYVSVTYSSGQVTAIITWTDGTMTNKLREIDFTYNANGTVATIVKRQYDQNTYALVQTMTGVVAYNASNSITSITWTRT